MKGLCDLRLHFDASAFSGLLDEMSVLAAKLPPEFIERLLGALDAGAEFFVLKNDLPAASGADELVMRPEPSDRLLGFMAACGARNPDLKLVDDALCHLERSSHPDGAAS